MEIILPRYCIANILPFINLEKRCKK